MTSPQTTPESRLRAMQVIAGALPMGVVMFAIVALVVIGFFSEPPDGQLISLVGIGFAVMMFMVHLVIPGQIAKAALKTADANNLDALYGIYQTQMIIGLALLEGAAFLNLVALIVEHNWWSLAIAGASSSGCSISFQHGHALTIGSKLNA